MGIFTKKNKIKKEMRKKEYSEEFIKNQKIRVEKILKKITPELNQIFSKIIHRYDNQIIKAYKLVIGNNNLEFDKGLNSFKIKITNLDGRKIKNTYDDDDFFYDDFFEPQREFEEQCEEIIKSNGLENTNFEILDDISSKAEIAYKSFDVYLLIDPDCLLNETSIFESVSFLND